MDKEDARYQKLEQLHERRKQVVRLHRKGSKLSMDGRGAWRDNVFVERLWRSVKYERVYLKAYDSVSAARADIANYLAWYNTHRSHSSLEQATPDERYFAGLPKLKLAA